MLQFYGVLCAELVLVWLQSLPECLHESGLNLLIKHSAAEHIRIFLKKKKKSNFYLKSELLLLQPSQCNLSKLLKSPISILKGYSFLFQANQSNEM